MRKGPLLLLLSVLLLAAGCQPEGSQENDGAGRTDSATGQPTVELSYAFWGTANERAAQERMIAKFMEQYPYIHVTSIYAPGDYATKLTTLYASNKAPDVFLLHKESALQWAEQGKLHNLKEFMDADPEVNEQTLIPNAVMYWDEGKIAGVKVTEESFAIYYNKDMFEEANVPLPPVKAEDAWTWDEFISAAKRLTFDRNGNNAFSANFDPTHIEQYGVRLPTYLWHLFVPSNDASMIAADGSHLNLDDPAVIEAVQKMVDLIYVHHVAPSPIELKNLPEPTLSLQSKKVAMNIDGQWIQLDLAAAKVNFGVGVLPKLKKSTTIQFGEPIVMSATSKHPKEAWLLYKWLLDAEHAIDMYASGLWMPLLKDYYTKPELIAQWATVKPGHPDGYEDAVMRQTYENGVNSFDYYLRNIEQINLILSPALDQIFLGKKPVKEAFEEIAPKVNAVFKGTYP